MSTARVSSKHSPTQVEVRERILAAARHLEAQGGYDAVQLRQIARDTGLSTATIYKHFSSKDHLIAEVHLHWVRQLESNMQHLRGETGAERVLSLYRRALRSLERDPKLGRSVVLSIEAHQPEIQQCREEEQRIWADLIRQLLNGEVSDLDEAIDLLGIAWSGATIRWAHGLLTTPQMITRVLQLTETILAYLKKTPA